MTLVVGRIPNAASDPSVLFTVVAIIRVTLLRAALLTRRAVGLLVHFAAAADRGRRVGTRAGRRRRGRRSRVRVGGARGSRRIRVDQRPI